MNSIIFDIDGTICPIKKPEEEYIELIPYKEIIDKIKELKKSGYKIILFTARNMRTYQGNIDLILKNTKPILETWLEKWQIPYDEIIFGKPYPGKEGYYVDDRTIRPKELLEMNDLDLKKLMNESRL